MCSTEKRREVKPAGLLLAQILLRIKFASFACFELALRRRKVAGRDYLYGRRSDRGDAGLLPERPQVDHLARGLGLVDAEGRKGGAQAIFQRS